MHALYSRRGEQLRNRVARRRRCIHRHSGCVRHHLTAIVLFVVVVPRIVVAARSKVPQRPSLDALLRFAASPLGTFADCVSVRDSGRCRGRCRGSCVGLDEAPILVLFVTRNSTIVALILILNSSGSTGGRPWHFLHLFAWDCFRCSLLRRFLAHSCFSCTTTSATPTRSRHWGSFLLESRRRRYHFHVVVIVAHHHFFTRRWLLLGSTPSALPLLPNRRHSFGRRRRRRRHFFFFSSRSNLRSGDRFLRSLAFLLSRFSRRF
mmetsp:Transcript_58098/g.114308  ORF Transcript_58098/g.114308 Transcript_58098/m.114308 type:complete len:263 (+) Transcript_58098:118-906(+)